MPAHGTGNGWHRDHAASYDYSNVAFPAPLLQLRASFNLTDQSELGMGNMALIPGSHRSPVPLPRPKCTTRCTPARSSTSFAPGAARC